jgi:hypothetical protein
MHARNVGGVDDYSPTSCTQRASEPQQARQLSTFGVQIVALPASVIWCPAPVRTFLVSCAAGMQVSRGLPWGPERSSTISEAQGSTNRQQFLDP